jgi:pimeloyl-ACP methyl ester carboxylesterase
MNLGQLIPELSKTRKVIAIELQGHGHTPFSERKLSHVTLASDVAGVMDHLKIDSADVAGFSFGGAVYPAYQAHIFRLSTDSYFWQKTINYGSVRKDVRISPVMA